jgi:hypothetical protein
LRACALLDLKVEIAVGARRSTRGVLRRLDERPPQMR